MSVRQAKDELLSATRDEIHASTAVVWAERAVAAYEIAAADQENQFAWGMDAAEYEQEAIEHAALANDSSLLSNLRRQMKEARKMFLK